MKEPQTKRSRATGFDLVLPDGWWRIPLEIDQARAGSIRALMKQQFRGMDAAGRLRSDTEQMLARTADAAARQGGVVLWISTQQSHGIPLPMSLLATPLDVFRVRGLDHAADQMRGLSGVDQASLQPGRVLRRQHRRNPDTEAVPAVAAVTPADQVPGLSETETLNIDYWLEMPHGQVLQLAFASTLLAYGEPLVELFDTIVDTITWTAAKEES